MSKQKNYEVLKYNEPAFVGAGVAIIMAGKLAMFDKEGKFDFER